MLNITYCEMSISHFSMG